MSADHRALFLARAANCPIMAKCGTVPWKVDERAWENGILKTRILLKISPFEFERTIELQENEIRLGYQLEQSKRVG